MYILGIESSCDETSVAIVEDGRAVLSCVIASSLADFQKTGGVVPEYAARRQVECMNACLQQALDRAAIKPQDIDAIAVTRGPGLLGSLLVGTTTARALAAVWQKPLIGVHHTLGHLSSTWLAQPAESNTQPQFPVLTLSVSGGHTDLWYRTSHTSGQRAGTTRDDAAGEAFDKGATLLGLPYPGGPSLAKLADNGAENAYAFPSPLSKEQTTDFSFSGLKTSLKYLLRDLKRDGIDCDQYDTKASIAASYQAAICRHLMAKLSVAIDRYPQSRELHIVGGVSANKKLRSDATRLAERHGLVVRFPSKGIYSTDNAAMMAAAGYFLSQEKPEAINHPFMTKATENVEHVLA